MKSLAALFVIASICLWSTGNCAPFSSEESDEIHIHLPDNPKRFSSEESDEIRLPVNPTLDDLQSERQRFILELNKIEVEIDEELFEKDFDDVRDELRKLELVVWPRLLQLNEQISKDPTVDADAEKKLQDELQQIADRIKTKARPHV